jgi:hypothetical protein
LLLAQKEISHLAPFALLRSGRSGGMGYVYLNSARDRRIGLAQCRQYDGFGQFLS